MITTNILTAYFNVNSALSYPDY